MKALNHPFLAAALLVFGLFTACTPEDIDIVVPRDLQVEVDTILVNDPIALRVPSTSTQRVSSGTAHYTQSPESTVYLLASNNVTVVCESNSSLTSAFDGGEDLFHFQFVEAAGSKFFSNAFFNMIVDGRRVTALSVVPPNCITDVPEITYVIDDDRITGTITGEFFYPNPIYVAPVTNCDNWISVGNVEVSFDLPLVNCN